MSDTLTRLAEVLEARKGAAPDSSYVASLYHKGLNKILEKVGEESVETILAAKDAAVSGDSSDLIYETADLWFHSLVMLAALGQHPLKGLGSDLGDAIKGFRKSMGTDEEKPGVEDKQNQTIDAQARKVEEPTKKDQ